MHRDHVRRRGDEPDRLEVLARIVAEIVKQAGSGAERRAGASTMVYPSGGLFATARVATVPPAPGRFSMMICAPSLSLILSATLRATVLALPPGANGMTSVIGRLG
jgi:hypothetical protein